MSDEKFTADLRGVIEKSIALMSGAGDAPAMLGPVALNVAAIAAQADNIGLPMFLMFAQAAWESAKNVTGPMRGMEA